MATHREMMRRSQFWTRLFDPENRYIRGRWRDGSWLPGFDFKAMLNFKLWTKPNTRWTTAPSAAPRLFPRWSARQCRGLKLWFGWQA